jgi:hypothetical protein
VRGSGEAATDALREQPPRHARHPGRADAKPKHGARTRGVMVRVVQRRACSRSRRESCTLPSICCRTHWISERGVAEPRRLERCVICATDETGMARCPQGGNAWCDGAM